MGVCYDGVEGLLYLSLFSLLAACALSAMLCVIFRVWTLTGSRSVLSDPVTPLVMPTVHFCKVLTHALSLSVSVRGCTLSCREKEYDDIDEEDPFNPQAHRISYNPRRSNTHSFCSYTTSLGSQASLHPPPQSTSSVTSPPEYM